MNVVNHLHNKSGETIPNSSKVCNIYFPKISIRLINHRAYGKHLDPPHNGLPSSICCTAYTNYGKTPSGEYTDNKIRKEKMYRCMQVWDHVMYMFISMLNGITVALVHFFFGSTLNSIRWCLMVQ